MCCTTNVNTRCLFPSFGLAIGTFAEAITVNAIVNGFSTVNISRGICLTTRSTFTSVFGSCFVCVGKGVDGMFPVGTAEGSGTDAEDFPLNGEPGR